MITNIKFDNFKCFSSLDVDIYPLTLLTGINSSGKSTILQAVRMLLLGAPLQGYGSGKDLIWNDEDEAHIGISIDDEEVPIIIKRNTSPSTIFPGRAAVPAGIIYTNSKTNNVINLFSQGVPIATHISADRYGPKPFLYMASEFANFSVGEFGEWTIDFLNKYIDSGIVVPRNIRHDSVKASGGIRSQLNAWLSIISPNKDIDISSVTTADIGTITFNGHRPSNVGFGLSYTLPIIANILINVARLSKGENVPKTLLIENPEAHLHPKGQTLLGKFFARAISCGLQLIIETHSEHIVNGMRIAIKESELDASNLAIYYFSFDKENSSCKSQPIFCDENGSLDSWPEDFCDESEKNLLKLI